MYLLVPPIVRTKRGDIGEAPGPGLVTNVHLTNMSPHLPPLLRGLRLIFGEFSVISFYFSPPLFPFLSILSFFRFFFFPSPLGKKQLKRKIYMREAEEQDDEWFPAWIVDLPLAVYIW